MNRIHASIGALALGLLLGASAQAQAQLSTDNNPSLILLIWDPVYKVSYSRDIGLRGSALYNGLSDQGAQLSWTLDPATDSSFQKFVETSGNLAYDQWMVIGGGRASAGTTAGTQVIFTTMTNTGVTGGQSQWFNVTATTNNALRGLVPAFEPALYTPLMSGNGTAFNNYAIAAAGTASSYDTKLSDGYVGNMAPILSDREFGLDAGEAMFGGKGGFDVGNAVGDAGSSSSFYYLTPSGLKGADKIIVSAFGNSTQEARWNLDRSTGASGQQELTLSFNLPTAVVPEPSTYGLMLVGLIVLGFAAVRRRA